MANYYEKKDGTVKVGKALEALGWKLYGFKEDRSDIQSDYFDPESWEGVAVKGDFVACVNVSPYTAKQSGTTVYRRVPVVGETCPRCNGSKTDPLGWTLFEARANPPLFLTDQLRAMHLDATDRTDTAVKTLELPGGGGVSWLLPVVSPLHFDDSRRMKCAKCSGSGHLMAAPRQEPAFTWPAFLPNPQRKTWHVQKGGVILGSGTGITNCAHERGQHHAEALAARIDAWTRTEQAPAAERPAAADLVDGSAPALTENPAKGGIELRFPSMPAEEIRANMKAHGWRWSKFARCWYQRDTAGARAYAAELIERLSAEPGAVAR